jgi:hypothetical protein
LQQGELSLFLVAPDIDFPIHECDACGWSDRSADPVCPKCLSVRRAATLRTVLPALVRKHNIELEIVSGDAAQALSKEAGSANWVPMQVLSLPLAVLSDLFSCVSLSDFFVG